MKCSFIKITSFLEEPELGTIDHKSRPGSIKFQDHVTLLQYRNIGIAEKQNIYLVDLYHFLY